MGKDVRRKAPKVQLGDRFGRLVVLAEEAERYKGGRVYRCRCDCGTETLVLSCNLKRSTRSCGCLRREIAKAPKPQLQTHGFARHGHRHPLYATWQAMNQRCRDPRSPAYKWYGARGIVVCERWRGREGFPNFLADMGERPTDTSLDRVDPNGNYEPENCRWATTREQADNKRKVADLEARIRELEAQLAA